MSSAKRVIEISPGLYSPHKEDFEIKWIECPRCRGKKEFSEEIGRGEFQKYSCEYCKGKGHLKAKVTIEYTPSEMPEEKE